MANSTEIRVQGLQPVQVFAGLVGLCYLVFGIFGLIRTGVAAFTGPHNVLVLGFMLNPLHAVMNIVVGALGLLMALSSGLARTYGWILFIGFGLVGVWGLMITGLIAANPLSGWGNPLNLNDNDNWLHLGTAVVGLIIAILPARKRVHAVTPSPAH